VNRLTHNFPAKVIAIFLFVISTIVLIGGVIGIVYLAEYHFYGSSVESAREEIFEDITRRYANIVFHGYFNFYQNDDPNSAELLQKYERDFSEGNTNFLFNIKNEKGEVVLSNYSNQEVQFSRTYYFEYYIEEEYREKDKTGDSTETYTIDCYVNKTLNADDRYSRAEYWINLGYSMRYVIIAVTIFSFIASILLFVFLMCSAGRRRGKEEITPNGLDKIPFDILSAAILILALIVFVFLNAVHFSSTIVTMTLVTVLLVVWVLLFLMLSMSFATRYKLGGWWKNTIVYRFLKFIYKVVYKMISGIRYLLEHLSLLWNELSHFIRQLGFIGADSAAAGTAQFPG
jgi:hypothetical protein